MRGLIFSAGLCLAQAADWPMLGWDTYRDYELYSFRPGEETHQFSSYDRANHNDDGFNGTYSCLRMQDSRCVIADYKGAGEIASIWFTYDPDSVAPIGDITITLDGTEVLKDNLQMIVDSETKAPFVWPFVGNTNDTNGGNVIKVPMAFSKSMLITTESNPHFYHVDYRKLPADAAPKTFDPSDPADDVVAQFKTFGVRDPKSIGDGALSKPGKFVSGKINDASGSVSLGSGCGIVSQLAIRVPSISPSSLVTDDGRAFAVGSSSLFTMSLDPNNKQCKLTRRIDRTIGNQKVSVHVNNVDAGSMDSGDTAASTWGEQVFDIPAEATNGKSSVDVVVECLSSDVDCNEFFFALHCEASDDGWKSAGYMPRDDWTLMDLLNVGPNNPHDELAHSYKLNKETWNGLRIFKYDDDAHTDAPLPDIKVSLSFDGKGTVSEVPIGAFFGAGLAKALTRSLLLSVDSFGDNGAWTIFYPMPFSKNAEIRLTSGDGKALDATVEAVVQECPGNAPSSRPWGHFSTEHHRGETTKGKLWQILSTKGPGIAYGHTHTFRGSILPPDNALEFLEGDEQVWLNRTTPGGFNDTTVAMLGTGTEDYYESGWYFLDNSTQDDSVAFAMPLTGLTTSASQVDGLCVGSCLSVYRLMVADSMAIPEGGISFNIEHGPDGNNIQADYETCAFYYV